MLSIDRRGSCMILALALCACGSRARQVEIERPSSPPLTAAPKPRDVRAEPQPDPAPGTREQDFVLPDEPAADPVELLQATKHDCCDEAPADEVQAGTRDQPAESPARKRR